MPQEKIETVILKREPVGIFPKTLEIKLGTTIAWLNAGQEPITIQFIDKLGVACKAPVNFHSDLFGHYETSLIETGGTASICFIFKGTYSYEVRRLIPNEQGDPIEEIATGRIVATE
jgi:plastocyanin